MFLTSNGIESAAKFLTVLVLFLFVLAITYFTTKWIAGFQKEQMHGRNMEIVETLRISQNKYLQILKIGKKYYALAICKDTVTLISEVSEDELNLEENQAGHTMDFKQLLEKAKNSKQKK